MVLADSRRISPVPPYSGYRSSSSISAYGAITLFGLTFQIFSLMMISKCSPTTLTAARSKFGLFPFRSPLLRESLVIFFSSGYLDVSVLRVGFPFARNDTSSVYRLSHSEIYGYNACVQLPVAYRSLPRPSSPLRAKASTIRPYSL